LQRRSTVGVWCDRVIEAGWLLALTLIPIYFNLLSARHFEPDKATSLRAIVLVMLGAWVIRGLEGLSQRPAPGTAGAPGEGGNPFGRWWRSFARQPLAVATLVYVGVFLLTTATSVVPRTSFFGSYQRLQGTYTNLSYILLFMMIVTTLRRREQLERLVTVMLLASLPVAGYGLVQHFQIDPLPWRGDVITRVASTMGNSIFVAAYMILVLPYALYRLVDLLTQVRRAAPSESPSFDIAWVVTWLILFAGCLAMLLGTIKFAAAVRTADFRYWWVFPGIISICAWLFALPTLRLRENEGLKASAVIPGFLLLIWGVLLGLLYMISSSSGVQAVDQNATNALDWGWWVAGGMLLVLVFYGMAATLPRSEAEASKLSLSLQMAGIVVTIIALLIAIFFTQSRGPWLGALAGIFLFITLLLWRAMRRARINEAHTFGLLRGVLVGWLSLALLGGGFLLAFNLSDAPVFQQMRDVPYLGRMGRLLETDEGTGKVRLLIWRGDEKAGGAIALILSEPLRTIVGWGPESMFVAYNKYYPPTLANLEARGASPDRSHQAILDELVTKGFLGLVSYLYLLIAFVLLAWRIMRNSAEWHYEVFAIATLTVVASHFVEAFVGIPIVSTLMMFWITLGVTVVAGQLAGVYTLGGEPAREAVVVEATPAKAGGTSAQNKRKPGQQRRVTRGATSAQAARGQQGGAAAWLVYTLVIVLTLAGVWVFNFNVVYADMRFQQGQAFGAGGDPQQQLVAYSRYLDAIRLDTDEDFYYLNFGRTLMALSDIKRQQAQGQLGEPNPNASVYDLLRLSDEEAQAYIFNQPPLAILSYAESALQRARQLNPRNKDHYANLARLNSFWYTLTGDQQRLYAAEDWYRQAGEVAPQDVVIKSEWAGTLTTLGRYDEAGQILAQAKALDPNYPDIDARQADLLRTQGKLPEAVDLYLSVLERNPHQLDPSIQGVIDQLQGEPELLAKLRDAYAVAAAESPTDDTLQNIYGLVAVRAGDLEAAVEAYNRAVLAQPSNLQYRRNYALVLSDTNQLDQALQQARAAADLAGQQGNQSEQQMMQGLVQYLEGQLNVGG
jgi:tetratricopeptide (TPR) repeat protein/O-antigen ligase